ncbi:hypothetical protein BHM03_00055042 [Ensete ventricosum]|nr:hypothetical protein BHM03_00055042 [Ensete ventricosum]
MAPYGPKVLTTLAPAPHDVVRGIHDAAAPGRSYLCQVDHTCARLVEAPPARLVVPPGALRAEKRSPSEAGPADNNIDLFLYGFLRPSRGSRTGTR